ncbi:MAG: DUF2069 domain-containing protein [Quisquiliibacterium sp.]
MNLALPGSRRLLRRTVLGCFAALVVLGLCWELWLAPLRPGGSLLALKVLPAALALPVLRHGRVRSFQWWSMGILLYLCEGLVRASSDPGLSAHLAMVQTALSLVAYLAILLYVRASRAESSS